MLRRSIPTRMNPTARFLTGSLAALALGANLLVAQGLVAPSVAFAQEEKTAAQLRDEAKSAIASGEVGRACVLFEQAYQASTKPGESSGVSQNDLLFDLADCHERQGYGALAAGEFEQVASAGGANAADAKARADKLRNPAPAEQPKKPEEGPVQIAPAAGAAAGAEAEAAAPTEVVTQKAEPPTRVGDFMDTRITWVFGDDDVLHQTGQAFPLSPNVSLGDRRQYRLFFDNLNSRFAGRENLTHLALYKKMPGFIKNLDTEASLLMRIDMASLASGSGNVNRAFYDAGTYIRAFFHTDKHEDPKKVEGLGLTLWAIDADRFRLGYLYEISWGGSAADINQSIFPRIQGAAPGAKLSFEHPKFNAFIGFKTATIVQVEETLTPGTSEVEQIRIGQANYGLLAGGGVHITDNIQFDAGGGYFTQGKFDLPDVQGEPIYTFGASARLLAHHTDMPASGSVDFALYRNDPNRPMQIFKAEKYIPEKFLWQVSLEGSALFQNLKSFETTGATELQSALAGAAQAQIKTGFFRASLTGIFRDLGFVLRNQPSFIPFQTIPEAGDVAPEVFLAAAADYYIESARLTPGIGGGLQFPSTFTSNSVDSSSAPISRTVVVREQGNIAILPVNVGAAPIIQARATLRWDISPILASMLWVQYVRDNNGTFIERDPNEGTVALRTFISPDFLGFGTAVQARF